VGDKPLSATKTGRREDGKAGGDGRIPSPQRTRIPSTSPRFELVVTPRANGGLSIAQGPVYVLVGPKEIEPLLEAMRTTE
jgi:hypothetical protein